MRGAVVKILWSLWSKMEDTGWSRGVSQNSVFRRVMKLFVVMQDLPVWLYMNIDETPTGLFLSIASYVTDVDGEANANADANAQMSMHSAVVMSQLSRSS